MAEKTFVRIGYNKDGSFNPALLRARDVVSSDGKSLEEHVTDGGIHLNTSLSTRISNAIQNDAKGAATEVNAKVNDASAAKAEKDLSNVSSKLLKEKVEAATLGEISPALGFDNLQNWKGCEMSLTETDISITLVYRKGSVLRAKRLTDTSVFGTIKITEAFYGSDGVTVLQQAVNTINESTLGGVIA